MSDPRFLIWWLSQEACEDAVALGANAASWPAYIKSEFEGRVGRSGRGRLWIAAELVGDAFAGGIAWDDAAPRYRAATKCGGIVIRSEDVHHLMAWPGFVTNEHLEVIARGEPA